MKSQANCFWIFHSIVGAFAFILPCWGMNSCSTGYKNIQTQHFHNDFQNASSTPTYPPNIFFSSTPIPMVAKRANPLVAEPPITSVLPESFFKEPCGMYEEISAFRINQHGEDQEAGSISFYYLEKTPFLSDTDNQLNTLKNITLKSSYDYDGYIELLSVEEREKRKGIGSALFLRAIQKMKAQGCQKIVWRSLPFGPLKLSQKQLNAFYEKLGGQKIDVGNTHETYFVYAPHQQQIDSTKINE